MTAFVEYMKIFDLIIMCFLGLRMLDYGCGLFRLACEGGLDPVMIDLHEPRQLKHFIIRSGTLVLIAITATALNWGDPVWQAAGLTLLGSMLLWRWLYFVNHKGYAYSAALLAGLIPLFIIVCGGGR